MSRKRAVGVSAERRKVRAETPGEANKEQNMPFPFWFVSIAGRKLAFSDARGWGGENRQRAVGVEVSAGSLIYHGQCMSLRVDFTLAPRLLGGEKSRRSDICSVSGKICLCGRVWNLIERKAVIPVIVVFSLLSTRDPSPLNRSRLGTSAYVPSPFVRLLITPATLCLSTYIHGDFLAMLEFEYRARARLRARRTLT